MVPIGFNSIFPIIPNIIGFFQAKSFLFLVFTMSCCWVIIFAALCASGFFTGIEISSVNTLPIVSCFPVVLALPRGDLTSAISEFDNKASCEGVFAKFNRLPDKSFFVRTTSHFISFYSLL